MLQMRLRGLLALVPSAISARSFSGVTGPPTHITGPRAEAADSSVATGGAAELGTILGRAGHSGTPPVPAPQGARGPGAQSQAAWAAQQDPSLSLFLKYLKQNEPYEVHEPLASHVLEKPCAGDSPSGAPAPPGTWRSLGTRGRHGPGWGSATQDRCPGQDATGGPQAPVHSAVPRCLPRAAMPVPAAAPSPAVPSPPSEARGSAPAGKPRPPGDRTLASGGLPVPSALCPRENWAEEQTGTRSPPGRACDPLGWCGEHRVTATQRGQVPTSGFTPRRQTGHGHTGQRAVKSERGWEPQATPASG